MPASPLEGLLEELGKLRILTIWFSIVFLRMREKTVYMAVQKGMQVQNWNYVTNLNDEYVETKFIRRLYSSVDGFPGDVTVSISYRLNNNNRLTILFEAFDVTESTVFNPTNHVYFNLSDKQDLSSHELQIYSDYRLELDSELIPTGQKN